MKIANVLQLIVLGTVVAGGGVVIKNQQDQIGDLREANGALSKRQEDNNQSLAAWKAALEKGLTVTETKIRTAQDDMTKGLNEQAAVQDRKIASVKAANQKLSDRVATLETSGTNLSNKLGIFEASVNKLDGRITSVEKKPPVKTDNQIRTEMVQKVLPSVVDIDVLTPKGPKSFTGSVIDDRKGNLAILTAGHHLDKSEDHLNSIYRIYLKNGLIFQVRGNKMPDGSIPWSSVDHRDFTVIRLTDQMQTLLKKTGIKPIPIAPITKEPLRGSDIVAIGREGKVVKGTFNRPHYYPWLGRWRSDLQTDTPVKKGDSGGPFLNLDGEMIGIASWGTTPSTVITAPKELKGKLKVDVDALTGIHYFVSSIDLLRGLGSIGYPLTRDERSLLLKTDVLEDRPYLLTMPAPQLTGQVVPANLLTYLSQLSELDGYAFRK